MIKNSVINTYLIKEFLFSTFNVVLIFSAAGLIMNLREEVTYFVDYDVGIILPIALSFMIIPSILINIFPFIIFISSMWVLIKLKNKKVIIEGRDIGTVILPKADIKFFFKCDLNTAAKRRFREIKKKNKKIKFNAVKKQLQIRNFRDVSRKNSPLLKSPDAVIVDTGKLRKIPQMMKKMSEVVERKIKSKYGS